MTYRTRRRTPNSTIPGKANIIPPARAWEERKVHHARGRSSKVTRRREPVTVVFREAAPLNRSKADPPSTARAKEEGDRYSSSESGTTPSGREAGLSLDRSQIELGRRAITGKKRTREYRRGGGPAASKPPLVQRSVSVGLGTAKKKKKRRRRKQNDKKTSFVHR